MSNVSMVDGHIDNDLDNQKMTDEQIVKALECCKEAKLQKDCLDLKCPLSTEYGCNFEQEELRNKALDLINRQKAEIERLRNECGKQSTLWSEHFESLFRTAKETIRQKAIKEVTAELYNGFKQYETYDKHSTFEILDRIESVEEFLLNNLAKEMVGDAE